MGADGCGRATGRLGIGMRREGYLVVTGEKEKANIGLFVTDNETEELRDGANEFRKLL